MEGINRICSLIIFLYLIVIFLFNYYKNSKRKKQTKYLLKLKNIKPTISFYSCNLFKSHKLFWISLLELIDKKYYSLKEKNDKLYIVSNNKNNDLEGYQLILKEYIDSLLNSKEITIEELDSLKRKDIKFNNVIRDYMLELKKETNEVVGNLDRINDYTISAICTFLYSLQIIFFLIDDVDITLKLLIAIPFTYLTILFSDLLKSLIGILTKKKYLIIFLISIILSVLAANIWNSNTSNNYIIFHIVMGIFTCMYPLLIVVNIYLIRSNCKYKNNMQSELIEQMNNLSEKDDYLYLKVLKIKTQVKNHEIDSYFKILDL